MRRPRRAWWAVRVKRIVCWVARVRLGWDGPIWNEPIVTGHYPTPQRGLAVEQQWGKGMWLPSIFWVRCHIRGGGNS